MNTDTEATGERAWSRLKRHFVEAFTREALAPRQARVGENSDGWRDARRRHAYRYILSALALVLLPLIIYDVSNGLVVPALGLLLLFSLVLFDIIQLTQKRDAKVAPYWFLLISIGLVMLSLHHGVSFAFYLLFPLVAVLPILVRMRWAVLLGLLAMVAVVPWLVVRFDAATISIIELSLGLCWMISAWLVFSLKQQTRRLHGIAITDPLTGLFNRRYLELQTERAFDTSTRYDSDHSILVMDIDHFKRINDSYGHSAGDQALKAFAQCVGERVRKSDCFCRFGGEEFVLLLAETDGALAAKLAEELRAAVEAMPMLPQGRMTVSIGVCDASLADHTQHWFRLADNALYAAKSRGRNCVQVATGEPLKVVPLSKSVPEWR